MIEKPFLKIFQVVIILWSRGIANVSRVQYLVLATNLFKAAFSPAAENVREREKEKKLRCLEAGYLFVYYFSTSLLFVHFSYIAIIYFLT